MSVRNSVTQQKETNPGTTSRNKKFRSIRSQKLLGTRIRELRLAKGWSQKHLARSCGMGFSHIGAVERGQYDVELLTLLRIAKGLGVTGSYVVKGVG
jgi:ribosome-binding protein aMBF1 (putative translation factor)